MTKPPPGCPDLPHCRTLEGTCFMCRRNADIARKHFDAGCRLTDCPDSTIRSLVHALRSENQVNRSPLTGYTVPQNGIDADPDAWGLAERDDI